MQPIKTTNPMNPAPAKGIESFPTPVIDDVVISEIVNSWKGDYQPLEYGTLWKDVPHAPNQGSFPEHKLVYQEPTSEDGQWVKRIWVNDRVNQDSYNYAIKYSAGSQDHPIYIRTYILPREGYAPLPDGTPDPLFPTAVLVDEEVTRNEGELDSKYITVTRVYETLPGPAVPTKRYNERGDLETVIVQTVPPNTPPDPDGLLVTGSQVEQVETGKGFKTTATVQDHALLQIKENKEGLLGETITTDDIVDPSTSPDALSQTIVASTVEQYTATKARKRTTTANGPTSLSQKSNDGKLLGDLTSTQSVVAPDENPDAVSSTIISSEVKQVDSGKAIKTNVVLNSTPTLSGNQSEQGLLGNKTTTESIVSAGASADPVSLSIISSTVEPIDSVRSRKITVESSGPSALSGGQNKEGLLGQTIVDESIVAAGSQPDLLSQTIVSSTVEPIDSAKSKKITITSTGPTSLSGRQKKEGLLGETSINESIVAAGTQPDALSQTVISSVVEPIDSAKSKKITITSTGPTSLSQASKDGKLLGDVTLTESIVPPSTIPDSPDSIILSSEVRQIDSGKSVKKNTILNSTPTLSGGQTGEGLLGTKTTKETIVPAGSNPDPVSLTVISSQIEPVDSVRSRKVTIESSGPTLLSNNSLVDSPLGLLNANIEKSIVPIGTQPSTDEVANLTIVKDSINSLDESKSEREKVDVTNWPTNTGIDYDDQIGIGVFYTETIIPPSSYINKDWSEITSQNIKPLDQWKSIKKEIDKEKVADALLNQWYKIGIDTDISLPDRLLNVIAYWGRSYGDGGDYDFGAGAFTGSYNRNQSGQTKSSAGISGDIYFNVLKGFNGKIPGYEHIFFIEIGADGSVSQGDVLQRLNELEQSKGTGIVYKNWPYLQLRTENIVIINGSSSTSESKSLSRSVSINGISESQGQGNSRDVSVSANSVNVPECLHGNITIQNEYIGGEIPPELFVTYGVRPEVLTVTKAIISGVEVDTPQFPVGNYLLNSNIELYKWGFVKITARTASVTSDYV